jgi:glycosyltransferase involved in cell wall biosynthesis
MSDACITFAVPFYGAVVYLERAIASIRSQTVGNWRAIVVDDCAPQAGARELVEGIGDARLMYSRNAHNLGLSGNWNRCIELSTTPLVTLLHSDDELLPHYAQTMLDAHAHWPNAAAIFCAARIIDADSRETYSFRDQVKQWLLPMATHPFVLAGEDGVSRLARGNFVMCPTLCYNRDRLRGMKFSTDFGFVADLDFYFHALMSGAQFVGVPDVAYRYRRHPDQVTAQYERDARMFTEEIELWRWAARESRKHGWERAAVIAERMHIIKLQLIYYVLGDLARFRLGDALAKLHLLREVARAVGKIR